VNCGIEERDGNVAAVRGGAGQRRSTALFGGSTGVDGDMEGVA
jgi:hypothetical protein